VGGLIAIKTHTNEPSHFRMTPNKVAVAPPAKYWHVEWQWILVPWIWFCGSTANVMHVGMVTKWLPHSKEKEFLWLEGNEMVGVLPKEIFPEWASKGSCFNWPLTCVYKTHMTMHHSPSIFIFFRLG